MHPQFLSTVAAAALTAGLAAQTCPIAFDINQTGDPLGSAPRSERADGRAEYLELAGFRYFTASEPTAGRELWRTDGTAAGTTRVKDIRPGPIGTSPSFLIRLGNHLYFAADDGVHGRELWRSDGTAGGTQLVKDILPGLAASRPEHFTVFKNRLFFAARDTTNGVELWSSDGTAAGTSVFVDAWPGTSSSAPSDLAPTADGRRLFFRAGSAAAGREIWSTDGTPAGTALVKDIRPGTPSSFPSNLVPGALPFEVYFSADDGTTGSELWRSDGTPGGTVLVKDIQPGTRGSSLDLRESVLGRLGTTVFFRATDGVTGWELWRTDGTAAGTVLVKDILPGTGSGTPAGLFAHQGTLYFSADSAAFGSKDTELWKSDGTTAGTVLVKNIAAGSATAASRPGNFAAFGSRILFAATSSGRRNDRELWITDGTTAGTQLLKDIDPGTAGGEPASFSQISATKVLFSASDSRVTADGRELWETDGTTAGTKQVLDINPTRRPNGSGPSQVVCPDGKRLYFSANDETHGPEAWTATKAGARLLKDITPGSVGSFPTEFTSIWNGTRFLTLFVASDPTHGRELWRTDGTTAGTQLVKDIFPGLVGSGPTRLHACDGVVYFAATDGTHGQELWRSDGTAAGTFLLKDIFQGSLPGGPVHFECCAGKLFFAANNGTNGGEIWTTDGTTAGTRLLKDIVPGAGSGLPNHFQSVGDRLAFVATTPSTGFELWVSDGTTGGTTLVKDIRIGAATSQIFQVAELNGLLYFGANDGASGPELWRSDLTNAGTRLVADAVPGAQGLNPRMLKAANGLLFFTGGGLPTGSEVHVYDGRQIRLVADIYPGTQGSFAGPFTAAGGGAFFQARGAKTGRELHFSDGTALGTRLVCDLLPGFSSSSPTEITVCDDQVYFRGFSTNFGSELYSVGVPQASALTLGESCGPNRPSLEGRPPILGSRPFLIGRRAPASGPHLVILGAPKAPFTLPGVLPAACTVWLDLNGAILLPVASRTAWSTTFFVPNDPTLVGVQLRAQAAYGPVLHLTNAVQLTIGN